MNSAADDLLAELGIDASDDADWRDRLLTTKGGAPKATVGNALLYARHHPAIKGRLWFDERSLAAKWSGAPPWDVRGGSRVVDEHDATELAAWLTCAERVCPPEGACWSALVAEAHRRSCDPVADYLGLLIWDGTPRAETWLSTYLGAEPTGYLASVGRAWLISAVARVMKPGCQVDTMLTLEGEPGTRKSSMVIALAGEGNSASLSIDTAGKDGVIDMHGPWIIEWAELDGLSRREADSVNAFLTRRVDRFRAPYGRVSVDHPRRCVVVGSTNRETYLANPASGRRCWPVKVPRRIDIEPILRDRDQLWAEAVHLYRSGEHWWLEGAAEVAATDEQCCRLEADPWEDILTDAISQVDEIATESLYLAIGLEARDRHAGNARRISAIMGRLGWKGDRIKPPTGPRTRGYRKSLGQMDR